MQQPSPQGAHPPLRLQEPEVATHHAARMRESGARLRHGTTREAVDARRARVALCAALLPDLVHPTDVSNVEDAIIERLAAPFVDVAVGVIAVAIVNADVGERAAMIHLLDASPRTTVVAIGASAADAIAIAICCAPAVLMLDAGAAQLTHTPADRVLDALTPDVGLSPWWDDSRATVGPDDGIWLRGPVAAAELPS